MPCTSGSAQLASSLLATPPSEPLSTASANLTVVVLPQLPVTATNLTDVNPSRWRWAACQDAADTASLARPAVPEGFTEDEAYDELYDPAGGLRPAAQRLSERSPRPVDQPGERQLDALNEASARWRGADRATAAGAR